MRDERSTLSAMRPSFPSFFTASVILRAGIAPPVMVAAARVEMISFSVTNGLAPSWIAM